MAAKKCPKCGKVHSGPCAPMSKKKLLAPVKGKPMAKGKAKPTPRKGGGGEDSDMDW